MNRYSIVTVVLVSFSTVLSLFGQSNEPDPSRSQTVIHVESRAVLVDVIVTDSSGKPVTGLPKDAFTVTEQGKPQTISFFEENGTARPPQPVEMPKLPPDVFTNFSPYPQPPAVNVLLLDSLNTRMEDQSVAHKEAMKFLKGAKPGTRTAIFTMGLALHFIQGFNDDPAVLAATLNNKKNIEVEPAVMLKSQAEKNAMAIIDPQFVAENDGASTVDRELRTLANLQRLAAFLLRFPGRKNIIWFAEKVPGGFVVENGQVISNPIVDDEIRKTLAMLGAARAAIYPVDARGNSTAGLYTAENNPKTPEVGTGGEHRERNSDQIDEQILAEQSGGRAFVNTNDLSGVVDKVTSNSSHFYTLSYVPTNAKMDGGWRKIDVKVAGGKYSLSYRRGYFAVDTDPPGAVRNKKAQKLAAQSPEAVDPLLPFMDLGMPQSEQILYKVRIVPSAARENEPIEKKDKNHYTLDFAIDLNDLKLDLGANGLHKGTLNVSLIVYDRYGNVISHEDHVAELNIKPDVYATFQNTGVQLHSELVVPNGNFWLRTGVYDKRSRKVGTMEVALSSVVPLQVSTK
ncbi:MAG: VWA domain-containing protein [Terracidiphilus sp.]